MPGISPTIAEAAAGLYFISESDFPLEPVSLESPDPAVPVAQVLLSYLGQPAATPVQEQELSYFFRNHTRQDPSFSAEKNGTAQRFELLQAVLVQELKEVKAYRIGEIRVQAFILGRDAEGQLSGLKTTQIET